VQLKGKDNKAAIALWVNKNSKSLNLCSIRQMQEEKQPARGLLTPIAGGIYSPKKLFSKRLPLFL